MIRLDIWSDPICPWCYIGKTALERALESRPAHPFVIEWHPFQLNPDMPAEGMDRQEYLSLKFGGTDAVLSAYAPVVERARAEGLALDLAAITRTPNTLDAHRLIHWAGVEGCQSAMVAALFRAYFREGRDIGDRAVLIELAALAGLDPDTTGRLLASDAECRETAAADREARARGITGVPFYVVGGEYAVPGAQKTRMWQNVIDDIAGQARP